VDAGIPFPEALKQHGAFIDKYRPCLVMCCGDWDMRTMLPIEARIHNIEPSGTYRRWINIKKPFADIYGTRGGMAHMLAYLKLDLLGRHHSGIDDCVNIARIALQMLKDGWQPSATTK
jgi:inhibitor of KinA sporulation pathway (predicted exonuclease)